MPLPLPVLCSSLSSTSWGSALGTSVLNMLLFVVTLKVLPDLVAVCMASGISAIK